MIAVPLGSCYGGFRTWRITLRSLGVGGYFMEVYTQGDVVDHLRIHFTSVNRIIKTKAEMLKDSPLVRLTERTKP